MIRIVAWRTSFSRAEMSVCERSLSAQTQDCLDVVLVDDFQSTDFAQLSCIACIFRIIIV